MGIVNEYIVDSVAILADLDHFQTEALLYESELIVLAKNEFFTMLDVDCVLLTAFVVVDDVVAVVVEDDTVLKHLGDAGTLVLVGCFQYFDRSFGIGSHATGKEMSAGTETELCGTEWILNRTVRARLGNEATG